MTPLAAILKWWKHLPPFPQGFIASEVCFRLTSNPNPKDEDFVAFLSQKLPMNEHVGRVIAVRAVIEFWFFKERKLRESDAILHAADSNSRSLRMLANAALGRAEAVRQEVDAACDSWLPLSRATLSDDALLVLEQSRSYLR